jgi:hypothetical protein
MTPRVTATMLLSILALAGGLSRTPALAQDTARENFIILVPYLNGEISLAKSVANLLRLQVSATFREGGTPTRGRMVWGEYQLPSSSHEAAVRQGMMPDAASHLVLWGDAYQLSDGVAVQAFLSITPRLTQRQNRPEAWSIELRDRQGGTRKLALGLPRRLYQFPPILISSTAASKYQDLEGMPIFETVDFKRQTGTIGKIFRAFEYTETAVRLESNNATGWVRLDFVADEQNIVVEFSGAIIRLCRGDYDGSRILLAAAAKRKSLPASLLTDVYLLLGLIEELHNRSGLVDFPRLSLVSADG